MTAGPTETVNYTNTTPTITSTITTNMTITTNSLHHIHYLYQQYQHYHHQQTTPNTINARNSQMRQKCLIGFFCWKFLLFKVLCLQNEVGGCTQCLGYHYSQELVPTISGNERAFMLYVFNIFPYQSISDDWVQTLK